MEDLADKYVKAQDELLDKGKRLEKLKFLQTAKSPGLKATIVEEYEVIQVLCPHFNRNTVYCDRNPEESGYCIAKRFIEQK
jgi:hypothetical protein